MLSTWFIQLMRQWLNIIIIQASSIILFLFNIFQRKKMTIINILDSKSDIQWPVIITKLLKGFSCFSSNCLYDNIYKCIKKGEYVITYKKRKSAPYTRRMVQKNKVTLNYFKSIPKMCIWSNLWFFSKIDFQISVRLSRGFQYLKCTSFHSRKYAVSPWQKGILWSHTEWYVKRFWLRQLQSNCS